MAILDKINKDMRTQANTLSNEKENRQVFISLNDLVPSKKNEQILIVDDGLKETIQDDGLLTPLLVMRKSNNNKYEIISGNRRYTAIKSLIRYNPEFMYKWKGSALRHPIKDGVPCNIIEALSDIDKTLLILSANKVRDYDKLEQYRSVIELKNIYETLKEKGKIQYGEGRLTEWLAARLPISSRTISSILADKWIINSNNYVDVVNAGSFELYNKVSSIDNTNDSLGLKQPKLTNFDKEFRKLESIENHYDKFKSESFENYQLNDIKNYAITVIGKMMEALDISGKELS